MTDYVELHCHSYYSLRDGASSPEVLIQQAKALGINTLALTDHDAVYGAPAFAEAAAEHGVRPIFGSELTIDDHHLTLLVESETGWANLCWLITEGRRGRKKGTARLSFEQLDGHTAGLIALSGCREGEIAAALLKRDEKGTLDAVRRYQALFERDHFYIELQRHLRPDEGARVDALVALAARTGLEVVATNNVHYAERSGHELQAALVSIKTELPLANNPFLRPNSEFYLKPAHKMARLFGNYPDALAATRRIAERCQFDLGSLVLDFPRFPTPEGQSSAQYLRELVDAGARERYGEISDARRERLDYETHVIVHWGLEDYFLIVQDLCNFARRNDILYVTRGSAVGSEDVHCLGISSVDPYSNGLMFDRFLSLERRKMPDIDIDFQADRREEVIQYAYERWGCDHAAMVCTFSTFLAKSAIRDVGKALGLPKELIDRLAKAADRYGAHELMTSPALKDVLGDRATAPLIRHLFRLCAQIDGVREHGRSFLS